VGPAPIPIVAVVFHVDGVLIDSEPLWRRVERERPGTVSVDLTADDLMRTMGAPIHEVVGVWHRRHPWREPTPGELAEDIIRGVVQAIARDGELREGAVDAVGYFRELGLSLAVASSSPRRLIDAVLALGLPADWFDVILSGEGADRGKPDPAIYVSAARELGVAPERCLAVEDSVNGVRWVKGAGMVCVAIPEAPPADGTCDGAYLVLGSLHDLNGGIWPTTGTTPTAPRR
jgi:mannitol-1-/sugar-/sorbitol-6-/2-deoxyglucose-6-phosphatase